MSDIAALDQAKAAFANTPVAKPLPGKSEAATKKAAQDFEAVFLNEVFGAMFQGIKTDGPFGGGAGEDMFRSLLIDRYSRAIAGQGGFGIAAAVQRQLIHLQESMQ